MNNNPYQHHQYQQQQQPPPQQQFNNGAGVTASSFFGGPPPNENFNVNTNVNANGNNSHQPPPGNQAAVPGHFTNQASVAGQHAPPQHTPVVSDVNYNNNYNTANIADNSNSHSNNQGNAMYPPQGFNQQNQQQLQMQQQPYQQQQQYNQQQYNQQQYNQPNHHQQQLQQPPPQLQPPKQQLHSRGLSTSSTVSSITHRTQSGAAFRAGAVGGVGSAAATVGSGPLPKTIQVKPKNSHSKPPINIGGVNPNSATNKSSASFFQQNQQLQHQPPPSSPTHSTKSHQSRSSVKSASDLFASTIQKPSYSNDEHSEHDEQQQHYHDENPNIAMDTAVNFFSKTTSFFVSSAQNTSDVVKRANELKDGWKNEFVKVVAPLPSDGQSEGVNVDNGNVNENEDGSTSGNIQGKEEEKELVIEELKEDENTFQGVTENWNNATVTQTMEVKKEVTPVNAMVSEVPISAPIPTAPEVPLVETTPVPVTSPAPAPAPMVEKTQVIAPVEKKKEPFGTAPNTTHTTTSDSASFFFESNTATAVANSTTAPVPPQTSTNVATVPNAQNFFAPPTNATVNTVADTATAAPIDTAAIVQEERYTAVSNATETITPVLNTVALEPSPSVPTSKMPTSSVRVERETQGESATVASFSTPNNHVPLVGNNDTPILSNKQHPSMYTSARSASAVPTIPVAATLTAAVTTPSTTPTPTTIKPASIQTSGFKIPKFNKPRYPSPRIARRPLPSTLLSSSTPDRFKKKANITTPNSASRKSTLSLPTPSSGLSRPRQYGSGHGHSAIGSKSGSSIGSGVGSSPAPGGKGGISPAPTSGRFRMPPPVSITSTPPIRRRVPSTSIGVKSNVTVSTAPPIEPIAARTVVSPLKSPVEASGGNVVNDGDPSENLNDKEILKHLNGMKTQEAEKIETELNVMDIGAVCATNVQADPKKIDDIVSDRGDDNVPRKNEIGTTEISDVPKISQSVPASISQEAHENDEVPNILSVATEKSSNVTLALDEKEEEQQFHEKEEEQQQAEEKQAEEKQAEEQAYINIEPPPPPVESGLPPLPDGWIELTVPDSGKKYYLNIETRVTTWERPVPKEFCPPPPVLPPFDVQKSNVDINTNPTKSELEVQDIAKDLVEEVEVQERSENISSSEDIAIYSTGNLSHSAIEETHISSVVEVSNDLSTPIDATPEKTPDSDIVITDLSVGKDVVSRSISDEYVHVPSIEETNTVANEPYDQPGQFPINELPTEDALQQTQSDVNTEGNIQNAANDLAHGWVELLDEATGTPYYYNERHGKTSWEKPVDPVKSMSSDQVPSSRTESLGEVIASNESVNDSMNISSPENTGATEPTTAVDEFAQYSSPEDTILRGEDHPDSNLPSSSKEVELAPEHGTTINETDIDDLPTGWVEMVDPSSGIPYYYNEKTLVTSWERPPAEVGEDCNHVESDENLTKEVALKEEEGTTDVIDDSKSSIKPITIDSTEFQDNVDSKENQLPSGWIEMMDTSTGLPFYVNETEGITTWEKPLLSPLTNEGDDCTQEKTAKISNGESEEVSADQDFLNPDDVPSIFATAEEISSHDNADNQHFNESSKKIEVISANENEDEGEIEGEIKQQVETELEINDLPQGWVELTDANSGLPYYYNEAENVTTWEKPSFSSLGTEAHEEKEDVQSMGELNTDNDDFGFSTEMNQNQELNVNGQKCSNVENDEFITQEEIILAKERTTSVEISDEAVSNNPDEVNTIEEDAREALKESEVIPMAEVQGGLEIRDEAGAVEEEKIHMETSLPSGWVELTDINSGLPYYYNEAENITTWDKPILQIEQTEETITQNEFGLSADLEDEDVKVNEIENELNEEKSLTSPEEEVASLGISIEVAAPFKETKSSGSDAQFKETKSSESDENANNFGLLPGWIEVIDTTSGLPYYYNETEEITTWDKPTQIKTESIVESKTVQGVEEVAEMSTSTLDVDKVDVPGEDMHGVSEAIGTEKNAETNIILNNEDEHMESSIQDLPSGWEELIDESSGLPYYFNKTENKTTWDKPTTSIAPKKQERKSSPEEEENPIFQPDQIKISSEAKKEVEENTDNSVMNIPPLPDGWIEKIDPTSRKPYYYNEAKVITTWERPSANETSKEVREPSAPRQGIQDEWVDVNTPSETKNETSYNVDEGPSSKEKSNVTPLPKGWVELIDKASGKNYYYNEEDNVTTWDRPSTVPVSSKPNLSNEAQKNKVRSLKNYRHRPAHAIASFGFGGRLCIMIPQVAKNLSSVAGLKSNGNKNVKTMRKGPVLIHKISSLIPSDHLPNSSGRDSLGPLNSRCEEDVLSHLSAKSGTGHDDNELLWNLIYIAARWKGRLRSVEGISDPKGPEAAIVDLLLQNNPESNAEKSLVSSVNDLQGLESSSLEEIQKLLLRGKREDAVKYALTGKHYALALLIASVCDHSTYHAVARCFVDKALPSGTPLHTVAALFANQSQDSETDDVTSEFWNDSLQNLDESWRSHLASILSNQTQGWKKIVVSLGDQLFHKGKHHAAHFCYLISGCPFKSIKDPSSRLVLIGCDHKLEINQALITKESIEGYERTEALEWAKRKGNPNAVISTLQPLKLKYASILADYGFKKASKDYVDSIRKCTGIVNADDFTSTDLIKHYPADFPKALDILEDRLCSSMGIAVERESKKSNKTFLPSVLSKIVGGSFEKKELESDLPMPEIVDVPTQDEDEIGNNVSFISATSNVLDMTTATEKTTVTTKSNVSTFFTPEAKDRKSAPKSDQATKTPNSSFPKHDRTGMNPSIPKMSPLGEVNNNEEQVREESSGKNIVDKKEPKPATIKSTEDHKVAPPSSSKANSHPVKDEKEEEAPSSGWSIGNWITKKMNPDANIANPGKKMEAYYDEKLKRWIFPGDDPAEVAKPLAPPPKMSAMKNKAPTDDSTTPAKDDPLGSLMAPPGRTPSRGIGAGGDPLSALMAPPRARSHFSEPRVKAASRAASLNIPASARKPATEPGSKPAAPHFVIFQPVATPASETSTEKKSN